MHSTLTLLGNITILFVALIAYAMIRERRLRGRDSSEQENSEPTGRRTRRVRKLANKLKHSREIGTVNSFRDFREVEAEIARGTPPELLNLTPDERRTLRDKHLLLFSGGI